MPHRRSRSTYGRSPVAARDHKGFGSRIIEEALAHEYDGRVTMVFRPEGLVVTFDGVLPAAGGEGI